MALDPCNIPLSASYLTEPPPRGRISENGYALKDAFHRLHELSALFKARVQRSTRDPVVPLFHEPAYAKLAPEAWLVQRTVNRFIGWRRSHSPVHPPRRRS